jgi:nucleotide-binding universal stress UspA family protein
VSACSRVVCAVEASPAGLDVLERARRLTAAEGLLLAVTVFDPAAAWETEWESTTLADELRHAAKDVCEEAQRRLAGEPRRRAVLRDGTPVDCIRREIVLLRADLVVVGTSGHGRTAGIVCGSVSTALLHHAPCPVLLVRPVGPPFRFPRTIVVGVDGSPQSLDALTVARELASRLDIPLRTVVAAGGKPVDVDGLVALDPLEWLDGPPVEALARVADPEDLLVVGSRGLHGIRALGSVSERLAHEASCSVLVARPQHAARPAPEAAAAGLAR